MADTPNTPPISGGHDHGHGPTPMGNLWMAMTGASVGHHEEVPGVDPKAAQVGHEPDQFNARTIIYVPILVTIMLVVTYLIVQGAFAFVNGKESQQAEEVKTTSTDKAVLDKVREENRTAVKDWDARAGNKKVWGAEPLPKATPGEQTLPPTPQPGLEYTRKVVRTRLDANGNEVKDPVFVRSFAPAGKGNSPEIYPEDLRPERFRDPWTDTALLARSAWVKGQEGKLATVEIGEMIHPVTHDPKWKGTLKVAEKKAELAPGTLGKAKLSTGGVYAPKPDAVEKKDDGHKHD
jgi:hypothetical protein